MSCANKGGSCETLIVHHGNDTLIRLEGITDTVSGGLISGAVLVGKLYKEFEFEVTQHGSDYEFTDVVDSPGDYSTTIAAATADLVRGRTYLMSVTGTAAGAAFSSVVRLRVV